MIRPLQDIWLAAYYDGRLAVRRYARLVLRRDGLEIDVGAGTPVLWRYHECELTQGQFPGEPVRFERGEEALVVNDRRCLDAYRQTAYELSGARKKPLTWRQTVAAIAALSVATIGFMVYGSQAVGALSAAVIPPQWEDRLGKAVVESLAPQDDRCRDEPKQAAIEKLVARIRSGVENPAFDYKVLVATGPLNAFAAPGGYIVVFDEMLRMTKTPEQLAGVLAHEIQHVEQRHVTRGIFRQMTTNAVLAAVGGDVSGSLALDGGALLTALAHQRADEESADRAGMRALKKAGIDGRGMVEMFRLLAEETGEDEFGGGAGYLSTHPESNARAGALEAMLDPEQAREPLMSRDEWRKLRRPCRFHGADEEAEETLE